MTDEKADLEQLLMSAGWLRFLEYARVTWKDQLPNRLMAASQLEGTEGDKGRAMLNVMSVANEINALLSWPKERLARLKQPETATTLSRGGYDLTPHR